RPGPTTPASSASPTTASSPTPTPTPTSTDSTRPASSDSTTPGNSSSAAVGRVIGEPGSRLNVYAEPDLSSTVVTTLPAGMVVTIYCTQQGSVASGNGGTNSGWGPGAGGVLPAVNPPTASTPTRPPPPHPPP